MKDLSTFLLNGPYQGYSYSYPHKSAYRAFDPKPLLKDVWQKENKSNLFLYLHIPFCEMRCGFCNLFTMANPNPEMGNPYLPALERQIKVSRAALGENAKFARLAIGGGTPTFLEPEELNVVFDLLKREMGLGEISIPASMEVSPKTVTREKLQLMKENGINRVSIGVQSFFQNETKQIGRPQKKEEVENALDLLREVNFSVLNMDFIYGGGEQTAESWIASLKRALDWKPEEIFMYPLYVRSLTGLAKQSGKGQGDDRLDLYRRGRDFLLNNGYEQVTMRIFRRLDLKTVEGPAYNSPEDGMLGLGVGARSYTKELHYSSDYAVGRKGVKQIIQHYNEQEAQYFEHIHMGVRLSAEEQRRRYVIKSLLEGEHLQLRNYASFFGSKVFYDLPELMQLLDLGLVDEGPGVIGLNEKGLEQSDAIGPWLYSERVDSEMNKYELT